MTVIQEKVETKLKYVSTARKRQRGRGTKYTSDGSDWSTGRINGPLGLRREMIMIRSLPSCVSPYLPLRQAKARRSEAERQTTFLPGRLRSSGSAE